MLFLLFSLSVFHVSSSLSGFSANINEKVEGVNQQKKNQQLFSVEIMYKVIAVCVANLTGLGKMSLVSSYAICQWCLWTHSTTLHQRWQPYAVVIHQDSFFPPGWMTQVCRHKACKLNGGKKIAKCELCSYFHSRTLNYGFKYTQH